MDRAGVTGAEACAAVQAVFDPLLAEQEFARFPAASPQGSARVLDGDGARFEGHPTNGAGSWLRGRDLWMHRTDPLGRGGIRNSSGFEGHSAVGATAGPDVAHLRVHRAGVFRR